MFIVTFCSSVVEVLDTWPPVITFLIAATKSCQDSQSTVIERDRPQNDESIHAD